MGIKEKTSEDTVYTLTINNTQATNIILKILEALKEDEVIIEKIKNYAINNFNLTEENVQNFETQYKETLQKAIDGINSSIQEKNTTSPSQSQIDLTLG